MPATRAPARPATVRFAATSTLGLVGTVLVGVGFTLVLALIAVRWGALQAVDSGTVQAVNAAVSSAPWAVSALQFVSHVGGAEAAWVLLPVTAAWLLVRRLPRLSAYVAVTGVGAMVLDLGVKAAVERLRPLVEAPVASAPGASFPSGHALGSTVTYGVLLLVFLPVVPRRLHTAAVTTAVAVVLLVGASRVALGVHYPSDVVGGWLLGLLWLALTATAFGRWREREGLGRRPLGQGLEPEARPELQPAPAHDDPLPAGWRGLAELLVAGVVLWGVLIGLGLLVTELAWVHRVDLAVVRWLASTRSDWMTTVATVVGHLGGTAGIVIALLVAVPLALGATRRWSPAVFLVAAAVGETALFLAVATVVERARPPVEQPSPQLPPTSSFPSGHVAATVVTYAGVALLVLAWSRGRLRWWALAAASVVVGAVAWSRMYRGVHYPTDVLASVLYGCAWLAACWRVIRPGPGPPR